jgi:uncharacterized protein with HEPN domain
MVNKDLIRLRHMSDSANAILAFVHGKNRKDLDTDRLLLSGILRELEILGEAAGKVSQQTKEVFPELPWKQMIGMRNRLIHAYFDVDHDIVWKTIKDFLPSFTITLSKIILNLETRE